LPKEYERIGRAFKNLSTVFNSSKYPGEETLTNALTAAGKTYEEIAQIVAQQAAVEKVKEADRLVSAGRISSSDKKLMNQRLSCMNYSLQGDWTTNSTSH
ncbi:hypothetical protein GOODEAATRI_030244, partial [Goodea atripinnis]